MPQSRLIPIFSIFAALVLVSQCTRAEEGGRREEIVLGMSTALSGPAADLGINMRAGVLAAIDECNRAGGIAGRKLRLIALDDAYEPSKTAPNMRKLIEEHKVLAVVGNVGTPTAIAAVPIAIATKTPFFGAFTGAGMLRKTPPDRYVINYRASYAEETATIVDALVNGAHLKPVEIAFFTQRDGYGDSGFAGGLAALKQHGVRDDSAVPHVRYERNTLAVEKALSDLLLLNPPPKAVVMVGAYAPCAAFVRLARENALDALFVNVSFVGSESLAKALGKEGDGVIISQVVPHFGSDLPIARAFRAALRASSPDTEATFGSMEGYVSTRILVRAMATIDGNPTREALVDALEASGKFNVGLDEPLELGKGKHQACHHVWATELRGGKVVPIEWAEMSRAGATNHE
jgi:branched-chain amino acid transport system substrate-binding protein